jgi:hypothetical protein
MTRALRRDYLPARAFRGAALTALLLVLGFASNNGYEVPLTPSDVHEAWTIGQRNDRATSEAFAPYLKQFTEGSKASPHLAEIDVLTPFAQVLEQSTQKPSGFSEQQAIGAYQGRGDTVMVRIRLMLPAAYPQAERSPRAPPASHTQSALLRPENFWQSFKFAVKQRGKVIPPRSVHNKAVYSAATKATPSTLDGQTVWLEYDAKSIASDELTVEVTPPEGQTIATTFDLRKLR